MMLLLFNLGGSGTQEKLLNKNMLNIAIKILHAGCADFVENCCDHKKMIALFVLVYRLDCFLMVLCFSITQTHSEMLNIFIVLKLGTFEVDIEEIKIF